MIGMNIINHALKALIILLLILSVLIAAFELGSPVGVARPFVVKNECLEAMKQLQGATYFYLMEHPKFNSEVTAAMLVGGGYVTRPVSCRAKPASGQAGPQGYAISYKRNGSEIVYIDVSCPHHGSLSRQGDIDKEKGLPNGFVDNYIARVKTRFDLY